jgi:hypothetical protein
MGNNYTILYISVFLLFTKFNTAYIRICDLGKISTILTLLYSNWNKMITFAFIRNEKNLNEKPKQLDG